MAEWLHKSLIVPSLCMYSSCDPPLQNCQAQQEQAHNSPFQILWPARLPAHLCLLNKTSISDLKEPFLNSSCWAFPQPVDPTGVPPVVERRNEAAAYCHITESEVIHVFTLLHDYVQFNISHSSAEENTVSSSLCSLYQFPIIRFFHNTPIILIFTVKYWL